jgi:hypothetical protein
MSARWGGQTTRRIAVLKRSVRTLVAGVVMAAVLLLSAAPASAHEQGQVGDVLMLVGWVNEPTYAGYQNAVGLNLNELGQGQEEEGPPISDAEVQVVLFGEENAEEVSGPLTMDEAFSEPGLFEADIIPTRPGTYTFHFTGTVAGQEMDEFFTSSEDTFSDVNAPADISFPVRDPSTGDLAQALQQSQAENADLISQVEDAESSARSARTLAIVGIIAGALGVVVAIAALARRRSAA